MNVYDFDNTIYNGESTLDFFMFCVKKHPLLIRFLPKAIGVAIRYKRCRLSKEELYCEIEKYDREFLKIAGDIRQLSREFWDKNIYKIKNFYSKIQKEDDVIVSASFGFLLNEAMKRLNIKNCICSEIDINSGKIIRLCFDENKVQYFKESFPDEKIHNFYSDSMNDRPLMLLAENSYIVRGEKIVPVVIN